MLHHISFAVSDIKKSSIFYDACLSALGYRRVYTGEHFVGYGLEDNKDLFGISQNDKGANPPSNGFHLAFSASNKNAVDLFFRRGTQAGGRDNGKPGLREKYGPQYYAAFLIDPDGYHIEAVINH